MRHSVLAVVLVLRGVAAANQPPPTQEEIERQHDIGDIRAAIAACSAAVGADGRFGALEVTWRVSAAKTVAPGVRAAHGLRPQDLRCLRRALATVSLGFDGVARAGWEAYPIGDEDRAFGDGFLAALQRSALGDPRSLRALAPAWIELVRPGCFRVRGPAPLHNAAGHWELRVVQGLATAWSKRTMYSLGGPWWMTDLEELDRFIEYCVERVPPITTALRKVDRQLRGIADGLATLDAEWVVDARGAIAGEVGMCMTADPRWPITAARLVEQRAELVALLRTLDVGPRTGFERVRIHAADARDLDVAIARAAGPLARARSAVERRCPTP